MLCGLVDKFDYDRGFRFSTYAYRAIASNAYRAIIKRRKESLRFGTEVNESNLDVSSAVSESSLDVRAWTRLRGLLSQIMDRLDLREQLIIRCRYALGGASEGKDFPDNRRPIGRFEGAGAAAGAAGDEQIACTGR